MTSQLTTELSCHHSEKTLAVLPNSDGSSLTSTLLTFNFVCFGCDPRSSPPPFDFRLAGGMRDAKNSTRSCWAARVSKPIANFHKAKFSNSRSAAKKQRSS